MHLGFRVVFEVHLGLGVWGLGLGQRNMCHIAQQEPMCCSISPSSVAVCRRVPLGGLRFLGSKFVTKSVNIGVVRLSSDVGDQQLLLQR